VTPAPPPQPTAPTPRADQIYSLADPDVIRPFAISQTMPTWNPNNPVDKMRDFRGTLEIVIDETGKVVSAVLSRPVHPSYDAILIRTAQDWKFRPAMRNGVAVKYRYLVDIHLGR